MKGQSSQFSLYIQGVSKKMRLDFWLIALALMKLVKPIQIILKSDVHTQILNTETFLMDAVSNLKSKK